MESLPVVLLLLFYSLCPPALLTGRMSCPPTPAGLLGSSSPGTLTSSQAADKSGQKQKPKAGRTEKSISPMAASVTPHTSITPLSRVTRHQWLGSALLEPPSPTEGPGATKLRFISSFEGPVFELESPYSISSSSSTMLLLEHWRTPSGTTIKSWFVFCVVVRRYLRSWMMVSVSDCLLKLKSSVMAQLTLFSVVNIPLTSLYAHRAITRDCCRE